MKQMKLNIPVIIEIIVIIILLPVTISTWKTTYHNYKYYNSIKKVIGYYISGQKVKLKKALEVTQDIAPNSISLNLIQGEYYLKCGKIDKAKRAYKKLMEIMFEDDIIPKLGIIICRLYEIESIKDIRIKYDKLFILEEDINKIIRENPSFYEAKLVLSHIYIKEAFFYKNYKSDIKKAKYYIKKAEYIIDEIKKKIKELKKIIDMDDNNDGFISSSEWEKDYDDFLNFDSNGDNILDREEIYNIKWFPSKKCLISFYTACSLINYFKANLILERYPNIYKIPYTEIYKIVNLLNYSVTYLRRIYFLRELIPNLIENIQNLYGRLLSLPYISFDKREKLVKNALNFYNDLKNFLYQYKILNQTIEREKYKKYYYPSYFLYGIGVSYYYLKNSKALFYLNRCLLKSKDKNFILNIIKEIEIAFKDIQYKNNKNLREYLRDRRVVKYYERLGKQMLKNKSFFERVITPKEFVILNNYMVLNIIKYKLLKNKLYLNRALYIFNNLKYSIPSFNFDVGLDKRILGKVILNHNLYVLYKFSNNKEQILKYKIYNIFRKK